MKNFLDEIKERKIRKWLAIYISTAITTIGITHLISLRYNLPDYYFDIVFFTLLFGIIGTAIFAWFHGKEGKQKFKVSEIIIQSVLVALLFITLILKIDFSGKPKKELNDKVIAVLPFTNFNESDEAEFIADGITEDVLNQLSKVSDLKVISRTSVMKYKNSNKNISEISGELGAGSILEGSVRTFGNKIRIVGQLIDANNDVHIWSETYDRELEDIFDIQSDIAERIAAALHAKLLPKEVEQIRNKPTENLEAYTYYLKGRHHYYNYTKEENEKSIEFFKKALDIDSNYALAYSGLADAFSQKVTKYWEADSWIDSALVLSKKSISLDPNLAEGYKSLASVYHTKEEIDLAQVNYKKAIELNPSYWSALLNYGQMKMFNGQNDEAIYWMIRAVELAPNDIMGNISVSMVYKDLNCYESAIAWAQKALNLEPKHTFANTNLGELYLNSGNLIKAEDAFNKTIEIDSNAIFAWFLGARIKSAKGDNFYAYSLMQIGKADSAKIILDEELKDYDEYFKEGKVSSNFNYLAFAEIYSIINDKENAFIWWKKAIENGYIDANRVKIYPYFNNIKNEPEYKKLISLMETKIDSIRTLTENTYPDYFDCK